MFTSLELHHQNNSGYGHSLCYSGGDFQLNLFYINIVDRVYEGLVLMNCPGVLAEINGKGQLANSPTKLHPIMKQI